MNARVNIAKATLVWSVVVNTSIAVANESEITSFIATNNQLSIAWTNGFSPFQPQARTSLVSGGWINLGEERFGRSLDQASPVGDALFIRVLGEATPAATARYRVTFQSTWSELTHPTNFPAANEHYSKLVGGTHSDQISFWSPGGLASSGMESMAETGATSGLLSEVDAAIAAGDAWSTVVAGQGLGVSPGVIDMTFEISKDYPLITLIAMIAPSPDWFVGVHDIRLFEQGDWMESLSITLFAYDAGTDSGVSYGSGNADTNPKDPIQLIEGYPLEYEGSVAPFGTFFFERLE